MSNNPTQNTNSLQAMVESHDVNINELRAYVYQAVEAYNGKIENLENADAQTLIVIAKLVHKLNDAKERIKELEVNNAKWDTIYLAFAEFGESQKKVQQFLAERFGYSPSPLMHVPEKINSAQHKHRPQAADTPDTPVIVEYRDTPDTRVMTPPQSASKS